jgi:hypothetical protein
MAKQLKNQEQIAILRNLSQQAAATLVGRTARWLRDETDAPRNEDGSYDGPALVGWLQQSEGAGRPRLDDDSLEDVLLVANVILEGDRDAPQLASLLNRIDSLTRRVGESVGLVIVDELVAELRLWQERGETEPDQAKAMELEQQWEEERDARAALRIQHRCGECKRIRHGRRWRSGEPLKGYYVQETVCTNCTE